MTSESDETLEKNMESPDAPPDDSPGYFYS